jgi:MFS family permease
MTPSPPAGSQWLVRARSIRLFTMAYAFDILFSTLSDGAFRVGYARWLGAQNQQLGLLTSIPAFIQTLRFFTIYLVERVRNRKRYALILWACGYLVWVPIIFIPSLLPPGMRVWGLIAGISLMSLFFVFTGATYMAWISELVPEQMRGRFFGRRNAIGGVLAMGVSIFAGRQLDRLGESGGFGYVFGIALLMGVGFLISVSLQPPPTVIRADAPPRFIDTLRRPLSNRGFRQLLIYLVLYNIGLLLGGPFYSLYMLEHLKMSYALIQVCNSTYTVTNLCLTPLWGYLIDKYGCTPVFRLTSFGMAWVVLLWTLAAPDRLWPLFLAYFLSGLIFAGIVLAPMNLALKIGPESERQLYGGLYFACQSLGAAVAPLIAAQIMDRAAHWQVNVGGMQWVNFHLLFLIAAGIRLATSLLLPLPSEEPDVRALQLFRVMVSRSPLPALFHLIRFKVARQAATRARAEQRLGELRSPLAVEELIEGLDDPSPEVRRAAARALGQIGDERAVEALLGHLHREHEDLLPDLIEALGKIRDARAQQPLVEILRDPTQDRTTRRQAAMALAEFDAPEVRLALLERLASEEPPGLLAAVADSLGKLREWRAVELVYALLHTEPTPAVRGQLANALARFAGDEALLYTLLKAEEMEREVAVDRLLRGLRRRCERRLHLEEQAPLLEAALKAYQRADWPAAGRALARLGDELAQVRPEAFQGPEDTVRLTLLQLVEEAAQERPLSLEEVLLALVTVREMLHRLPDRP